MSSQSHPPATVQRQRERDLQFLMALMRGMTEQQHHLTLLVQSFLRRDRPDAPAMADDDVEQAARALAETYETASRGIIYEHSAGVPVAERLSAAIKTLIEAQRSKGFQIGDADVALVLRSIEAGARQARSALPGEKTAYLDLLKRVLRAPPDAVADDVTISSDRGGPG